MKLISDKAGSALTKDDIKGVISVFPDININSMKYIGEGFTEVESYSDDLCVTYDCLQSTEYQVNINGTKSEYLSFSLNSGELTTEDICYDSEEIKCSSYEEILAMYNCLGWALGISKWLSPSDINASIQYGLSKEQAITKFIGDNKNKYPEDDLSNFENIIEELQVLDSKPEILSNNTIIFYFKDSECTHATRYITQLGELTLNQWTSKFGYASLLSHDESELLSPQIYGTDFVYVGVVDSSTEL
jgi:hypothetical protein